MILVLPRRFLITASCICFVAAIFIRVSFFALLNTPDMAVYTLFPARMDSLYLGVLIAAVMRDDSSRERLQGAVPLLSSIFWVLLAVMGLLLLSNWDKSYIWMATFGYTAIALFYGTVVTLAALDRLPGQGFLRLAPLRRVGLWCFSVYLFHVPLHYMVWVTWEHTLGKPDNAQNLLVIALSVAISMAVAAVLMRLVEGPVIGLASRLKYDSPSRPPEAQTIPADLAEPLMARSPA